MPSPIVGKRVVITGSNSGIGLETLKILRSKGNDILAVDINTDVISVMEGIHVIKCDISVAESVDLVLSEAVRLLGGVDVFIANAGFAYYEEIGDGDWEKISRIYSTNVFSPIYSYERFVKHLDGREGIFAVTASAMGVMGMPGFTLYTSTKFAINGFQETVRYEKSKNVQLTALYPVATDTGFFRAASDMEFEKPFPLQSPEAVAKRFVKGVEKGRKKVFPSRLFSFSMILFRILPPVKILYIRMEKGKYDDFRSRKYGRG